MMNQRRRRPGGRRFFPRRKVCQFCVDKVEHIDYKDVPRIRRFVSEWGKIESRRKTGTCAPHQRQLALAIKRARYLAFIPYTGGHSLVELTRSDPRGDRGRRPFRDDRGPQSDGGGQRERQQPVEGSSQAAAPIVESEPAPAATAVAEAEPSAEAAAPAADGETAAPAPEDAAPVSTTADASENASGDDDK
jgi:small subunit ribosomal protein S18